MAPAHLGRRETLQRAQLPLSAVLVCLLSFALSTASCTGAGTSREPAPGESATVAPSRYQVPTDLDDGWQTSGPEELGLAREPLERMTEAIRRGEYPNVHAVLIAKDGRLVYEEYFAGVDKRDRTWPVGHNVTVPFVFHRDSIHDIRSAGKSIAGTLVGIALGGSALRADVAVYTADRRADTPRLRTVDGYRDAGLRPTPARTKEVTGSAGSPVHSGRQSGA